jgi:hypothetical protein
MANKLKGQPKCQFINNHTCKWITLLYKKLTALESKNIAIK